MLFGSDWFTSRGIPRVENDAMLLAIPDIRQTTDYDCGAIAIESACQFLGVKPPAAPTNAVQGMAPDTVEAVLRSAGLTVIVGTMDVEDLRHFTRTGRPVVCPCSDWGGHWVVVCGVERGRVTVQCPLRGRITLTGAKWLEGWTSTSRPGHVYDRWGIAVARSE